MVDRTIERDEIEDFEDRAEGDDFDPDVLVSDGDGGSARVPASQIGGALGHMAIPGPSGFVAARRGVPQSNYLAMFPELRRHLKLSEEGVYEELEKLQDAEFDAELGKTLKFKRRMLIRGTVYDLSFTTKIDAKPAKKQE